MSSEYLVATKHFGDRWELAGGLGWGRLAQRDGFSNPLSFLGEDFETRPNPGAGGISETGQLDFGSWFKGDAALFGGVAYQATEKLSFQIEYSTDAYDQEVSRGMIEIESPLNAGLTYSFENGSSLGAYVVGGTNIGAQFSYVFDPAMRPAPGGFDAAPYPIPPRDQAILAWAPIPDPATQSSVEDVLGQLLRSEGITLDAVTLQATAATVRVQNNLYDVEAQAIGRVARVMANVLPVSITTFTIISQPLGLPNSAVTLQRSDLEELQTELDGAWQSFARAKITDAPRENPRAGEVDGAFPRLTYALTPYFTYTLFDPDLPVRVDVGPELNLSYAPRPGLSFNGTLRYPLYSSIDDATRTSDSILPRVRSEGFRYAIESDLELNQLTAEYLYRPGPELFGRVTAGYLEPMFAGVSSELLWYPIGSKLALGAELNYAIQRDFDMLFGLRDYDVFTGHASAYYELGSGYNAQVDVGRYLAGDWGATFALDREFNNGFKVGAYFTLTDVPFEDFGEGSFDKGIRFEIPVSWLTGQPSRNTVFQTIQPVTRDGGARLSVNNRLYGLTRDYRADSLSDGWGRFFR